MGSSTGQSPLLAVPCAIGLMRGLQCCTCG
jgi:hypothetical protein